MAFVGSTDFSVEGDANNIIRGNQNVYNIQTAYFKVKNTGKDEDDEIEFGEYRTFVRRNIYKIQDIFQHRKLDRNGEILEQLVYIAEVNRSGRIGGPSKGFTVVSYSGKQARERWKIEFLKFSQGLRSDRVQLFGLNKSKIPSLILYGDLVPLSHLTDGGSEIGLLTAVYLWALARNLSCTIQEIWLDPKTGSLCRGPRGPDIRAPGPHLDDLRLAHTSPSTEFLKDETCLRYFLSQGKIFERMFLRALAATTSIPGLGSTFRSMPTNRVGVFSDLDLPKEAIAVRSGGGHYDCSIFDSVFGEGCLENKPVRMANGAVRFRLRSTPRRLVCLCLDLDWKEECSAWLAHAPCIFKHLHIPLDHQIENYALNLPRFHLMGTLAKASVKRGQQSGSSKPRIYLFVHPAPLANPPDASSKPLHYWSSDKAGATSLSSKECKELGLPKTLRMFTEWRRHFWHRSTYEVVHRYQEAKELAIRADKKAMGTEHGSARHLGFDANWKAVLPVERFEDVEKVDKEIGSPGQEKSMWVAVGDIPAFGF